MPQFSNRCGNHTSFKKRGVFVLWLSISFMVSINSLSLAGDPPEGVISATAPVFPHDAYLTGTSGRIKIEVEVNSAGNAVDTIVLETSASYLRKDSENAARQWKFIAEAEELNPRKYIISFVYRIMPKKTPENELTTIFHAPYEMEVRSKPKPAFHEEFPAPSHK